jgi:NADPH:quinone reductase-like Zn-dependent oxidoreductase
VPAAVAVDGSAFEITTVPDPGPCPGDVVRHVRAFGIQWCDQYADGCVESTGTSAVYL